MIIEKRNKRELILDATLSLLFKYGFHGTPISLIAKKADVGAGTIYRYFKNKDELINELFIEIKRRVLIAMYEGYDVKFPYKKRFKLLWVNMMNYYNKNPKEFIFIEQHRYAPYVSSNTRSQSNKVLYPVLLFFLEGKKKKLIKHLPLYTIIGLIYGPIITMVKLHLDHNKNITKEHVNNAATACWDAVKFKLD